MHFGCETNLWEGAPMYMLLMTIVQQTALQR